MKAKKASKNYYAWLSHCVSVVTRRARHINPPLNGHHLGRKCRDKMLALLWQQYVPITNHFMELLIFYGILFIVCILSCVWLTTHTDHIYYTLLGNRDQWGIGQQKHFHWLQWVLDQTSHLFTKMYLSSSLCGPKCYMSHIFTSLLEILLIQSFLGWRSLAWPSLQTPCANTNAYQYLISIYCSCKTL